MPRPRLTPHGIPAPSNLQSSSFATFGVTGGVDAFNDPWATEPGCSPNVSNFVLDRNGIIPRSGHTVFPGTVNQIVDDQHQGGIAVGKFYDGAGSRYLVAVSARSVLFYPNSTNTWSSLSALGVLDNGSSFPRLLAQSFKGAESLLVWAHGNGITGILSLASNTSTFYSPFTYFYSLTSKAKAVESMDQRLVWLNVSPPDTNQGSPTRLVWSARGNPLNYDVASGAGFETLPMNGKGTAVCAADEDILYVFTNTETWIGVKRLDAFAFDFTPISRSVGCVHSRTAIRTPYGVVFLGSDMMVYLLSGKEMRPIGVKVRSLLQEQNRSYAFNAITNGATWGMYNTADRRYELYFGQLGSSFFALFYQFDNDSWWPQEFGSVGMAGGTDGLDVLQGVTTNPSVSSREYRTVLFTSNGTAVYTDSILTNDFNSLKITAYWHSPVIRPMLDPNQTHVQEVWTAYNNLRRESDTSTLIPLSSGMSVRLTRDGFNYDSSPLSVSLVSSRISYTHTPVNSVGPYPQFMVQVADGGKPKFIGFGAKYRLGGMYQ